MDNGTNHTPPGENEINEQGDSAKVSKLDKLLKKLHNTADNHSGEASPEPPPAKASKEESRASRRKPKVTKRVVEEEESVDDEHPEDAIMGNLDIAKFLDDQDDEPAPLDDDDYNNGGELSYHIVDTEAGQVLPEPSSESAPTVVASTSNGQQQEHPIEVVNDEPTEFVIPEGCVVVQPEAVIDSPQKGGDLKGPEWKQAKRVGANRSKELNIVTCTACNKQINTNIHGSARRHPVLKVLVCKKCYHYYTSDEIEQDSNGVDEQCRWCGEGGNLICCDYCHNAFCKGCIKRNLGRKQLAEIIDAEDDVKWHCYVCNLKPMANLIADCTHTLEALDDRHKKEKEQDKRNKDKEQKKEVVKKSSSSNKSQKGAHTIAPAGKVQANARTAAPVRYASANNQPGGKPTPVLLTQVGQPRMVGSHTPTIAPSSGLPPSYQLLTLSDGSKIALPIQQRQQQLQKASPRAASSVIMSNVATRGRGRAFTSPVGRGGSIASHNAVRSSPSSLKPTGASISLLDPANDIPVNEFNVVHVLDRTLAATQSMNMLLAALKEEIRKAQQSGGSNRLVHIKRQAAAKLKSAMVTYKKAFQDIEKFARNMQAPRQQAGGKVLEASRGAPVRQQVNARQQEAQNKVIQAVAQQAIAIAAATKKHQPQQHKPKVIDEIIELSDSSDEETSKKDKKEKEQTDNTSKAEDKETKEDEDDDKKSEGGDDANSQDEQDKDEDKEGSKSTEDKEQSKSAEKQKKFKMRISLGASAGAKRSRQPSDSNGSDANDDSNKDDSDKESEMIEDCDAKGDSKADDKEGAPANIDEIKEGDKEESSEDKHDKEEKPSKKKQKTSNSDKEDDSKDEDKRLKCKDKGDDQMDVDKESRDVKIEHEIKTETEKDGKTDKCAVKSETDKTTSKRVVKSESDGQKVKSEVNEEVKEEVKAEEEEEENEEVKTEKVKDGVDKRDKGDDDADSDCGGQGSKGGSDRQDGAEDSDKGQEEEQEEGKDTEDQGGHKDDEVGADGGGENDDLEEEDAYNVDLDLSAVVDIDMESEGGSIGDIGELSDLSKEKSGDEDPESKVEGEPPQLDGQSDVSSNSKDETSKNEYPDLDALDSEVFGTLSFEPLFEIDPIVALGEEGELCEEDGLDDQQLQLMQEEEEEVADEEDNVESELEEKTPKKRSPKSKKKSPKSDRKKSSKRSREDMEAQRQLHRELLDSADSDEDQNSEDDSLDESSSDGDKKSSVDSDYNPKGDKKVLKSDWRIDRDKGRKDAKSRPNRKPDRREKLVIKLEKLKEKRMSMKHKKEKHQKGDSDESEDEQDSDLERLKKNSQSRRESAKGKKAKKKSKRSKSIDSDSAKKKKKKSQSDSDDEEEEHDSNKKSKSKKKKSHSSSESDDDDSRSKKKSSKKNKKGKDSDDESEPDSDNEKKSKRKSRKSKKTSDSESVDTDSRKSSRSRKAKKAKKEDTSDISDIEKINKRFKKKVKSKEDSDSDSKSQSKSKKKKSKSGSDSFDSDLEKDIKLLSKKLRGAKGKGKKKDSDDEASSSALDGGKKRDKKDAECKSKKGSRRDAMEDLSSGSDEEEVAPISDSHDSDLEKDIEKLGKGMQKPKDKGEKGKKGKGKKEDSDEGEKEESTKTGKGTKGGEKKARRNLMEDLSSGTDGEEEEEEEEEEDDEDDKEQASEDLAAEKIKVEKKKKVAADREKEEKARRALLADGSSSNDNDSEDDEDEDGTPAKDKKTKKKSGGKKSKKNSSDDDSSISDDSVLGKKKQRLKNTKLLDAKISDSEDSDVLLKKKKSKKRKRSSSEDDSSKEKKKKKKGRKKKSSSSSEDSDSDSSRKKKKKGKKRRRIKKQSSSDGSDFSDEDDDVKEKGSGDDDDDVDTPGKKRKHIRKIMKDKKLSDTTQVAAQAELDRRNRIEEQQKRYNEITIEDVSSPNKCPMTTKLVLESKEDGEPLLEVNKKLIKKLKPHQVEAVKFLWGCIAENLKRLKSEEGSGCILAHCMGLGKTLSVIATVHTILANKKVTKKRTCLVVCPLNTVLNWQVEWEKWLDEKDQLDVYELSNIKDNWSRSEMLSDWKEGGGIMIIGYEMYRNLSSHRNCKNKKQKKIFTETLVDPGPDMVVCDEGHILKNDQSALSKAMNTMKTRRRIVLTGTPLQNNLVEYHCMINFVKPNLLGTRKEFLNRFANPITNGSTTDATPRDVRIMKRRAHVLHETMAGCVQRRDYSALTKYLTPKHEYVISVRLSPVQMTLYEKYLELQGRNGDRSISHGAKLFSDYQALMRIWTHPWVLKMQEMREENKRMFDDESDMDSFLNDSDSEKEFFGSSDNSKSGNSDSDDCKVVSDAGEGTSGARSTRASRANGRNRRESDDKDEVVKDWKTRSRGGNPDDPMAGTSQVPEEDAVLSTDWWGEHVTEEDRYKLETSGKFTLLYEILKMSEAIGDKVLVFSQSLLSLDLIENFLEFWDSSGKLKDMENSEKNTEENGVISDEEEKLQKIDELAGVHKSWVVGADYFRMDGSTAVQNRQAACDAFNDEENHRGRLFLISTKAGSLGINLVAANRVIIFDASWNPSHDIQSIFRVYRFGQVKPVYVYRFLAQGTMEEKIYERQVMKQSLSQRVVDEHQVERHFDSQDLTELYAFRPDRLDDPNKTERPTPKLPSDRLLAELLAEQKDWIVTYHEHDSLLENLIEEELTEEERKAAWDEFEEDKRMGTRTMPMNAMLMQQRMMLQQNAGQNQQAYNPEPHNINMMSLPNMLQVARAIYNANPGISQEELQQRVQHYMSIQQQRHEMRIQSEMAKLQMMAAQRQQQQQQFRDLSGNQQNSALAQQLMQNANQPPQQQKPAEETSATEKLRSLLR